MQALRAWGFGAEGRIQGAHLSFAGQQAVVGDDRGNVYYLDERGAVVWRHHLGSPVIGVRVTADGKAVFAVTAGRVYRINYKGRVLWQHGLPAPATALDVRSPSQTVLVGCGDLARVFSGTGREIGGFRLRHFVHSCRIAAGLGTMVVASDRGHITYIGQELELRWATAINAWAGGVEMDGKGGLVLLPGGPDGVYSFDHRGAPRGIYDIGGAVRAVAVDELGKRMIVAGFDGLTRLLNVSDGVTLWSAPTAGEVTGLDIDPSGDRVLVQKPGEIGLYDFVDKDEERGDFLEVTTAREKENVQPAIEWRVDLLGGRPERPPTFAQIAVAAHGNGAVVLEPGSRHIRAFNARGQEVWSDKAPLGNLGDGELRMRAAPHGNLVAFGGVGGLLLTTFDQGRVSFSNIMVRTLSVADAGNAVLAGDSQDRLHLFDAEAAETWSTPTDGFNQAEISPRGDAIGIARADGILRFYERGGGSGWQMDLTPGPSTGFGGSEIHITALEEGVGYVVADGKVGVRAPTGEALWERKLAVRPYRIERVGRLLAVTDTREVVHLFSLDGEPLRTLPARRGVSVLAEGGVERLLEFHYNGSEINCFDVEQGAALWRWSVPARVTALARSGCGEFLGVLAGTDLLLLRLSGVSRTEDGRESGTGALGTQGCFLEI